MHRSAKCRNVAQERLMNLLPGRTESYLRISLQGDPQQRKGISNGFDADRASAYLAGHLFTSSSMTGNALKCVEHDTRAALDIRQHGLKCLTLLGTELQFRKWGGVQRSTPGPSGGVSS